jgi:hypothetical protein
MKKMMRSTFGRLFNKNWVLAAALICGASVFTACSSNDDNPIKPDEPAAEAVHLTQQYSVSTLANGDTMAISIMDYIWEDGLLRTTHSYLNMPTYHSVSESDYFYVYDDDGNCIEEHYVSDNRHHDYYLTYEGGLMTSGIEMSNDEIVGKVTITGHTADGQIQAITSERLLTGTISKYEITWENGDMTAYTVYVNRPGEEEEIQNVTIGYDDYPNISTGMPLASDVFDPQMIASTASVHNWDIGEERFYANGRVVKAIKKNTALTGVIYYTYSDGTTGKE